MASKKLVEGKTESANERPCTESGEAKKVYVHGWIYELQSGRLRDLGVSRGPEGLVGPKFVGLNGAMANGVVANGNAHDE